MKPGYLNMSNLEFIKLHRDTTDPDLHEAICRLEMFAEIHRFIDLCAIGGDVDEAKPNCLKRQAD